MSGHIAVPSLDETSTPASLSKPIVMGLLREQLNFQGLIVTDDLEMGALKTLDAGEIGVRAIQAGNDLLLFCHAPDKAALARDAIVAAVDSGVLPREQVAASLERVRTVKRKYGII